MDKIFEQIPDLWFDLYARIIPGFYFVLIMGQLYFETNLKEQLLLTLFMSYVVGHIIQPLASLLARALQFQVFDRSGNIKKCRVHFDANSRESKLLSKQHAECASFSALAVLTGIIIVSYDIQVLASSCSLCSKIPSFINWVGLCYFIIFTFIRAHAVADRAKTYVAKIPTKDKV